MKILILITTVVVIAFACLGEPIDTAAQTEQAPPPSRLVGVVLDKNDALVAGAIIRVSSGTFKRRVRSNGDGRFEMELPAGCYELTAEQPGFRKFRLSPFQVRAGAKELVNIHLELAPPELPLKVRYALKTREEGSQGQSAKRAAAGSFKKRFEAQRADRRRPRHSVARSGLVAVVLNSRGCVLASLALAPGYHLYAPPAR